MKKNENLIIVKHPLIEHNFSLLRDKDASCEVFRAAVRRIGLLLLAEATKNVKLRECEVETPLERMKGQKLDSTTETIIIPILRAGLAFFGVAIEFLPHATIAHIGMYRDEQTLQPVWYLDKTKKVYQNSENTFVYLLDPMLATGNSSKSAIDLLVSKKIPQKNIVFVSLIAAPEGVKNIHDSYPNVKIYTASLDRELNNAGYILPGLGDAGDRFFSTLS